MQSETGERAEAKAGRLAEIQEWHARASSPGAEKYGLDAEDANALVEDVGWLPERNADLIEACKNALYHHVEFECEFARGECACDRAGYLRAAIALATGGAR